MPGKVGREHAAAVVRERAGKQRPDRMIEAGAVQENDRRQRRIERAPAGPDIGFVAVNNDAHGTLASSSRSSRESGDPAFMSAIAAGFPLARE